VFVFQRDAASPSGLGFTHRCLSSRSGLLTIALLLAAALVAGSGCRSNRSGPAAATESLPRSLRIVSLAPNFTEILFALDIGDCVVGRTEFCRYPEEARRIEVVGPYLRPNFERVIALAPHLVIAESGEVAGHEKMLKNAGIQVVVIDCKHLELIPAMIMRIGEATRATERAQALVREWTARRDRIASKTAPLPLAARPVVMVDLWEDPLMVAGPGSFVDELIQLAGGRNVAFDAKRNWAAFSVEAVVNRKPDVIVRAFMGSDADNRAAPLQDWNAMPGLEKTRVYGPNEIAPDILLQPGLRTVDALEKLAGILHPKLFPNRLPRKVQRGVGSERVKASTGVNGRIAR